MKRYDGYYSVGDEGMWEAEDGPWILYSDHEAALRVAVEALEIVRDCPVDALHLMPLAAQAALAAIRGEKG